jgi:aromatic ring-cleaving dioxygenase
MGHPQLFWDTGDERWATRLRQKLGNDRFDIMARSAEKRLSDLFEQLGIEIRAKAN